MSNLGT